MSKALPNRKSTRLKEYDYSTPAYYFVTVCTKEHADIFGKVEKEVMKLNDLGEIAESKWKEIPNHFEITELDYFVVMPNHIHGIIVITQRRGGTCPSLALSNIVGAYKAAVSKDINIIKHIPGNKIWQKSFYDRIIRNEKELYQIRKYIQQNPLKWDIEKNLPDNLEI